MEVEINRYVSIYGEQYRVLISDMIDWLDIREAKWGVKLNRDEYIEDAMSKIRKYK